MALTVVIKGSLSKHAAAEQDHCRLRDRVTFDALSKDCVSVWLWRQLIMHSALLSAWSGQHQSRGTVSKGQTVVNGPCIGELCFLRTYFRAFKTTASKRSGFSPPHHHYCSGERDAQMFHPRPCARFVVTASLQCLKTQLILF